MHFCYGTTCPFYHHMMSKETMDMECGKPTKLERKERREKEATEFVPWEEREAKECDRDLVQRLFVENWTKPKKKKPKKKKVQKNNKKISKPTKTDKKHKKNKKSTKAKKKSGKATKQDFSCKEKVSERILKLLKSSFNFKRSTGARKKTNSAAGRPVTKTPRNAQNFPGFLKDATERLQLRKSVKTKRRVKRRREARRVTGKVMDGLLDKVMRCVDAQQRKSEAQEKLMVEDDLR